MLTPSYPPAATQVPTSTAVPPPVAASAGSPGPVGVTPDPGRKVSSRANNLHYVERLFGQYRDRQVANRVVRDSIANGSLPALPPSKIPNTNLCLAFHTKGYCNANCGASADHVRYSEQELSPLSEWCAANYPAASPSAAAPANNAAAPAN